MLTICSTGLFIILLNLKDNIVFFYPPSELYKIKNKKHKVRIGGIVDKGSIQQDKLGKISFILIDNTHQLKVLYQGMLPALFREGQGIVAEGILHSDYFIASKLLTKHDENYSPPSTHYKDAKD